MALKPRYSITNETAASLSVIERARGFLEASNLSEDWILSMQARALVLEAHHTTHIEGTTLTLEQSEKLLAGKKPKGVRPDDARELLNYREAFELVSEYLGRADPITEGLVREIHKRLVRGVRGDAADPGNYRKIQNYVVNSKTGEAVYTPPSAFEVPRLMAELVRWANEPGNVHPVLVSGIAQFQFVHIHPFLDGNGRTARLLSTLCLYRTGYDFKRLFTISEFYDRDRPAYYRAIQQVRESGMDLTGWLEYFTGGLATQMREVQERGERIIRKDLLRLKAVKLKLKESPMAVLDAVLGQEKATVASCEKALKADRRWVQRNLKILVEAKLIREVANSPTDPAKYYEPML